VLFSNVLLSFLYQTLTDLVKDSCVFTFGINVCHELGYLCIASENCNFWVPCGLRSNSEFVDDLSQTVFLTLEEDTVK
jgi:hypothetical protein